MLGVSSASLGAIMHGDLMMIADIEAQITHSKDDDRQRHFCCLYFDSVGRHE